MRNIFLAILLTVALVSCDSDEKEQSGISGNKAISVSKIILPPTGATQTFTVTTDSSWTLKDPSSITDAGIRIDHTFGYAGTTLVEISAGTATKDVVTNLEFVANGQTFATIPFIQRKPVLEIYPNEDKLKLNWNLQDEKTITIRSNTDWNITTLYNLDWVNLSEWEYKYENSTDPTHAYEPKDLDITISPNGYHLGNAERTLTLQFKGAAEEKSLNISQGFKTLLGKYGNKYEIDFTPCNSDKKTIQITSEFDSWSIKTVNDSDDVSDLLIYSPNNGHSGNSNVEISAGSNPSREKILGHIVLTAKNTGHSPEPQNDELKFVINEYKLGFNGENEAVADVVSLPYNSDNSEPIKFMSSGAWVLEENCDWLTIKSTNNKLYGAGSEYDEVQSNLGVILNTAKNLHITEPNKGSVYLKSSEPGVDLTAELPIVQEPFQFNSTIPEQVKFNSDETTSREYKINCSEGWGIKPEGCGDWLSVGIKNNGIITVNVKTKNTSTSDREGYIKIFSDTHESLSTDSQRALGYEPIICKVTQLKYLFEVSPNGSNFSFKALPEGDKKTINVTCSSTWQITPKGDCSWIKINGSNLNKDVSFSGDKNLEITVSDNTVQESRSGAFDIISEGNKVSFTVEQDAFVFDTKEESFTDIDAIPSSPLTVTLGESLGKWNVLDIPNWIKVNPESGEDGGKDIQFTLDSNITEMPESNNRECSVKITSENNSTIVKKVNFSQKAHWLTVSMSDVTIEAKPSSATQIVVKCASTWEVAEKSDWLKITNVIGQDGDGSFSIDVDDNKTGKERSATITVMSRTIPKEIKVTQSAK